MSASEVGSAGGPTAGPPRLPAPRGAPYRIAFVCLGNICRSPMADVVMTRLVDDAGLSGRVAVRSSGTGGWHVGEPMDPRAAAELAAEDYDPSAHRAQQFDASWLEDDLVLAMDAANLDAVSDGRGASERVRLLRSFDPLAESSDLDVPDPYYGGPDGFADVLRMVERCCARLLAGLEALDLPDR